MNFRQCGIFPWDIVAFSSNAFYPIPHTGPRAAALYSTAHAEQVLAELERYEEYGKKSNRICWFCSRYGSICLERAFKFYLNNELQVHSQFICGIANILKSLSSRDLY